MEGVAAEANAPPGRDPANQKAIRHLIAIADQATSKPDDGNGHIADRRLCKPKVGNRCIAVVEIIEPLASSFTPFTLSGTLGRVAKPACRLLLGEPAP